MNDVTLLQAYEAAVVQLRKYLPQLKLIIDRERFLLQVPCTEGPGVEEVILVTDSIRELGTCITGLRKGAELVRTGVLSGALPDEG